MAARRTPLTHGVHEPPPAHASGRVGRRVDLPFAVISAVFNLGAGAAWAAWAAHVVGADLLPAVTMGARACLAWPAFFVGVWEAQSLGAAGITRWSPTTWRAQRVLALAAGYAAVVCLTP